MADTDSSNLPAQIASAIAGIPAALVPESVKALNRLIGAGIDVPVAWLQQKKAQIEAQTKSFTQVEGAIAKAVMKEAETDEEIVERAVSVLVRKEYRKQKNREEVANAAVDELGSSDAGKQEQPPSSIEDDWLNVFERYAEDASSERMQKLWGRVLAGEIRTPGRYSLRTLRFLSEFSQADALLFADLAQKAFSDFVPKILERPEPLADISGVMSLESSGLIAGASSFGYHKTYTFNENGDAFMTEGSLVLRFIGEASTSFSVEVISITPLGQELLTLVPNRDARKAARAVASSLRVPQTQECYLYALVEGGNLLPLEILWQREQPVDASIEAPAG